MIERQYMPSHSPHFSILVLVGVILFFSGCAGKSETVKESGVSGNGLSTSLEVSEEGDDPFDDEFFDPFDDPDEVVLEEYDPLEPVNAAIFEFNYQFDRFVVKPVAKVWNFFIPPDVQQSFSNVFQNLRSFPQMLNNLFQGKWEGAGIETSRLLINTTLGVGGLFDPAGIMFDLETPPEDLGQTLGSYGVPPGPYLMVPFFGPFTLRDGIGFIGDGFLNPFNWFVLPVIETNSIPQAVSNVRTANRIRAGMLAGEAVNLRSLNLEKFQGVEEGTIDLYGAVRNGYLQQRQKAIQE